jgi:hypothetical protein
VVDRHVFLPETSDDPSPVVAGGAAKRDKPRLIRGKPQKLGPAVRGLC